MEKHKEEMIAEARRRNGVPLPGKSFEESFTYEPYFKALILWICVGGGAERKVGKRWVDVEQRKSGYRYYAALVSSNIYSPCTVLIPLIHA